MIRADVPGFQAFLRRLLFVHAEKAVALSL